MPSRRMLRHMRVLIKSAGGKFERSSEKREGNNEENGYKSLTCTYVFLFYSPTSCRSYLSAYEFCRRGFNKQIYSKVYFLPNSSEATSGKPWILRREARLTDFWNLRECTNICKTSGNLVLTTGLKT